MDSISPSFPRALDEFALECSVLKVACSEVLDRVADETLQIHGGYGYTEEFPAARGYRDARINRIFEGTNEINRLFIPGLLLRRAQRGRLPLTAAIAQVVKELMDLPSVEETNDPIQNAGALLENAKKLILFLAGLAHQKHGEDLIQQQEILCGLSDLIMDVFLGESAVLRVLKDRTRSKQIPLMPEKAVLFVNESVGRMERNGRFVLAALSEGDELKAQLGILRRLLRWTPLNSVALRRRIVAGNA